MNRLAPLSIFAVLFLVGCAGGGSYGNSAARTLGALAWQNSVQPSPGTGGVDPIEVDPVTDPRPDLVFTKMSTLPTPVVPGEPFTLVFSVANRGGSRAGASRLSVSVTGPGSFASEQVIDLPALNPRGAISSRIPMPAATESGLYRVSISVDAEASVDERNEGNNRANSSFSVGTQAQNMPDLIFETLRTDPSTVVQGRPFDIILTIRNQGDVDAAGFRVGAILSGPDSRTADLGLQSQGIRAGATRDLEISLGGVTEVGEYRLAITVDEGDSVDESNERNNTANPTFQSTRPSNNKADLVFGSMRTSPAKVTQGEPFDILLTIRNQGDVDAGASRLEVILSGPDARSADLSVDLSRVSAQGNTQVRIPLAGVTEVGEYGLQITVDARQRVDESDESNNTATVSFPSLVQPPPYATN